MDGKISEIIDNVLDTDDYINSNTQESFNSANSWNKLTYMDNNKLFKKEKEKHKDNPQSQNESEKVDNNPNKITINNYNINNEPKKILNEKAAKERLKDKLTQSLQGINTNNEILPKIETRNIEDNNTIIPKITNPKPRILTTEPCLDNTISNKKF